ncbi:MAG: hypothetical protein GX410_05475 [Elusimicrobia bacterium]|nr:hypothetical protein [Elusimicrobiota bacterium]
MTRKALAAIFKIAAVILAAALMAEGALRLPGLFAYRHGVSGRGRAVLCAGDSFVWGIGGRSFPGQLQQILDSRYGAGTFSVINAGVPGSNSAQMLQKLPAQLERYKPEFVIALTGRNNLWNKSRPGVGGDYWLDSLRITRFFRVLGADRERARLSGVCEPDTEPEGVGDFDRVALSALNLPRASSVSAGLPDRYEAAADIYLRTGNAYAALAVGRKITQLLPKKARGRIAQSRAYALAGDYASALKELEEAAKLEKDGGQLQTAYCRELLSAGFYEKAIPHCLAAESVEGGDSRADLIDAYSYSGLASEAVSVCAASLTVYPDSRLLKLSCARAYVYEGKLSKGRELAGSSPEFYRAMNDAGRYRELAAYAEEDSVSGGAEQLLFASRLLEEAGQFRLLRRVLDKALRLKPDSAEAYVRLGDLARRQCDPASAKEFYARAMRASPAYWGGYYAAGNLASHEGDKASARALLEKALSFSTQKHKVYRQLARLSLSEGKRDEAYSYYEKALALSPYDKGLCKEAARVYVAGGGSARFAALSKSNPDLVLNPVFSVFSAKGRNWQDAMFSFSGGAVFGLKQDLLRAAALSDAAGARLIVSSYPEEELPGAREAAAESGSPYVSLLPLFSAANADRDAYFSYDNDHPSTAGYGLMAAHFADVLGSFLQKGKK